MTEQSDFEPLAYSVKVAVRVSGLGRTKIYELIKSGVLDSVRVGGRRLVTAQSLKRLVANDDACPGASLCTGDLPSTDKPDGA